MTADTETSADEKPMETVDWDQLNDDGVTIPWRLVGFVVALGALAVLYWYSRTTGTDVFLQWAPTPLTWVFRVSLVVLAYFVVPPLVRNRERTRHYWRRFESNRLAVASLGYLAVFFVLAMVGPVVVGRPVTDITAGFQPPLFGELRYGLIVQSCVGEITGTPGNMYCHGTLQHPLGTTQTGMDMVALLISGMHVSLQVAVMVMVFMIPIATTVGIVAGYRGGAVDEVLMRYVDIQQSVPAFVVYIILAFVFGRSLFLLIAVFGLLNWGSVARLVRSEVLQRREEQYIKAAESAGMSQVTILRRHVLPNVSNTVIVGATQKIPQIVLVETAIAYIGLGDIGRWYQSFGETISIGFQGAYGHSPEKVWWIWLLPVVVITVTVVALSIVGDTLRDVLDPRGEL